MSPTTTDKKRKRRQRIRIILWTLLAVVLTSGALFSLIIPDHFFGTPYGLFLLTGIGLLVSISVTSKCYYNYGIFFLFLYTLFFLYIILLIFNLVDLSSSTGQTIHRIIYNLISVIFPSGILYFLVFSIRLVSIFRKNRFVQSFGFFSGVLVIMAFINFQFRGELFSTYYNYVTLLLLIILSFAMIFMLPGIDFDSWRSNERKVFYRMIIAPFALVLVLNIFLNIYPDLLGTIFYGHQAINPWGLQEIQLLDIEGVSPTTQ